MAKPRMKSCFTKLLLIPICVFLVACVLLLPMHRVVRNLIHEHLVVFFLGYPYGQKGYRVFDILHQKVLVSRDVCFFENVFPFLIPHQSAASPHHHHLPNLPFPHLDPSLHFDMDSLSQAHLPSPTAEPIPPTGPPDPTLPITPTADLTALPSSSPDTDLTALPSHSPSPSPTPPTIAPRRSSRSTRPPAYLQDFHLASGLPSRTAPSSSTNLVIPSGTAHPLSQSLSYAHLSHSHKTYLAQLTLLQEPTSFSQAVQIPQWRAAMKSEVDALQANGTWSLVSLPPHKRPIGCKWVYKVKLKADGTVERYKARLVAKGYSQVEGIDYQETFASVAKLVTVRVLLSVASLHGWHLHQLDVNNAFLNGDLDEEVFMSLPPGFGRKGENRVCQLHKSLYGLKQASRQWFIKLSTALKAAGFQQSRSDYSLFVRRQEGNFLALLVYVDDVILAGNNLEDIENTKLFLAN
ncbi:uncharacterized protein LOC109950224 [Prunus persica]|uniref:uncharacterized protein LOC109950224 n=1 Tax=Prunus persica TaxID=3760 RepID=UPI0009AB2BFF|nr:uncharacterized protein LOC109950224 [Prunus persica]